MPIILKAVVSLDGKATGRQGSLAEQLGPAAQAHVDALRAAADALCYGVGTVLADDPPSYNRPVLILDSMARTPPAAKLVAAGATVVVTDLAPERRLEALQAAGAQVLRLPNEQGLVPLAQLPLTGTTLVEGGGQLLWSFLNAGLADQLNLYYVPHLVGVVAASSPITGPQPPPVRVVATAAQPLGPDWLVVTHLERSDHP